MSKKPKAAASQDGSSAGETSVISSTLQPERPRRSSLVSLAGGEGGHGQPDDDAPRAGAHQHQHQDKRTARPSEGRGEGHSHLSAAHGSSSPKAAHKRGKATILPSLSSSSSRNQGGQEGAGGDVPGEKKETASKKLMPSTSGDKKHRRHSPRDAGGLQQNGPYTGDPVRPRGELNLLSLPHPTLLHILSFLSCKDLCMAGLISRRFNVLASENELWKVAIAREWSHKRMLKGYGKKHVLHQKNTKSKKISKQLMVIDYKQELKNHILFKRSVGKQAKVNRKKASVWNFTKRDCYLLLLGLDKSGKTTILYDIKADRHELIYSIPTIGYNAEELEILELPFAVWDVGGLTQIRHTWPHYMPNTQGLIWVLDSSDIDRMQEARGELHRTLRSEALRTRKLLVLANKQDLAGAWDARTIAKYLQLDSAEFMSEWEWYVQPCSVMTPSGREALCAGLEWLVHDSSPSSGSQESMWQKLKTSFA